MASEMTPEDVVSPGKRKNRDERPPVRWREILAVLALVVAADVLIFRTCGFAGYAAFFVLAPLLLLFGAPKPNLARGFWLLVGLLILLACRLLWCGSWLGVGCGVVLLAAFAMALVGLRPYVLETLVFASLTVLGGYEGLRDYRRSGEGCRFGVGRAGWLGVGLPLAALVVFGLLFIVANPDLSTYFSESVTAIFDTLREHISAFVPSWLEVLFWVAVSWIAVGLLRPVFREVLLDGLYGDARPTPDDPEPVRAVLYAPFRNTLLTVIVLFAVYLVFEFKTLWLYEFPEDFYFSGYAHNGAAWLTVALTLATAILSLIFRGRILQDARVGRLRGLAWVWSAQNLLLAVAVFHRLSIYVGFNGMTRMRVVAVFGVSCVVAGFLLVVWKIIRNRDFVWLLRHHLWALAITIYLFALTPVDMIVHDYNVRRILSGDPAPSVQITEHPISSEGVLLLLPLIQCDDATIREGVLAMLADRLDDAERLAKRNSREGWTTYQHSDRLLLEGLGPQRADWAEYDDCHKRTAALARFQIYAYQWY